MRHLIVIFFILLATAIYAQPGYLPHQQEKDFMLITKQLKSDPDNYELIWKRLNTLSNPYIDIYSKGAVVSDTSFDLNQPLSLKNWSYRDRLSDLNRLINGDLTIKRQNGNYDRSDFIFLRGKIYYLIGDYEKALPDYLSTLEYINANPEGSESNEQKATVCLAIAAYYYNLHDHYSGDAYSDHQSGEHTQNLRQALKYIDMVSPLEFTDVTDLNDSKKLPERFEREKIILLGALKEDIRLAHYYKQLMRNQYNIFEKLKAQDDTREAESISKEGYSYSTHQSYLYTLHYGHELANLYYESKNYKQAKAFSEKMIEYYPVNNSGYITDRYDVGEHYLLLNKIYQTEGLANVDQEMNSLLELLGGSTHGINYHAPYIGKYIRERLQKYPDEPRLYLALAIWHYKNNGIYPLKTVNNF